MDVNVNRQLTEEEMPLVQGKKPTKMMPCASRQEVQLKITAREEFPRS